ncbi:hypothetical protein H1R20_g5940, partial [Candolleomyces eurysporus]
MFSQFRQAVEQLAQQVPVPTVPTADGERRSVDLQSLASGQLAGDALTSLRKSLSQRSGSSEATTASSSPQNPTGRASPSPSNPNQARKSTLEERLRRATHHAISESSSPASSSPPPDPSKKPSGSSSTPPLTKSVAQKRGVLASPASTPLPQSPALPAGGESSDPTLQGSEGHVSIAAIPELELEKKETASPPTAVATAVQEAQPKEEPPVVEAKEEEGNHVLKEDQDQKEPGDGEATKKEDEEKSKETSPPAGSDTDAQEALNESAQPSPSLPLGSQETQEESSPLSSPESAAIPPVKDESSPEPEAPVPPPETAEPAVSQAAPAEPSPTSVSESSDAEDKALEPLSEETKVQEKSVPIEEPKPKGIGVEELQQRLKLVEQRFTDVSTSFKRLQAEKVAADSVLKELTPIDTIQDSSGLRDYLKNLKSKQEIFQNEIKLLNGKLSNYEERLEELRDVHRLESKSQSDQIEKLRTQLAETEALFQASEKAITQVEERLASDKTDTKQLESDIEKFKTLAREEEEKRVKAISLLKTVRQKLVKAEKEKEDALKEAAAAKDRDRGEKEKDHVEKLKLQQELELVQIEKEKMAAAQKAHFEREMTLMKERYEKEMAAVKGQLELEIITLKSSHSKELAAKSSQISTLENSLNNVTRDKNVFFEQLQVKQAETESAQGHLENLQHQNTELEYQLHEANDRLGLIREEYADYQREQEARAREPVTSASDIAQMVSATESKYELRLAEMKRSVSVLEKERSESEANWSRKLKEKVKELEELKAVLGSAAKSREQDINVVEQLKADLGRAREEVRILKEQLLDVPALQDKIQDLKRAAKDQDEELRLKTSLLEKQAEEYKSREAQLKQGNKRPSSTSTNKNEEEVNLEYLRNVILQFLEHKEMRPNLVKVISIILHFTPQETRRLMAKV